MARWTRPGHLSSYVEGERPFHLPITPLPHYHGELISCNCIQGPDEGPKACNLLAPLLPMRGARACKAFSAHFYGVILNSHRRERRELCKLCHRSALCGRQRASCNVEIRKILPLIQKNPSDNITGVLYSHSSLWIKIVVKSTVLIFLRRF